MTNKELQIILAQYPDDLEVVIDGLTLINTDANLGNSYEGDHEIDIDNNSGHAEKAILLSRYDEVFLP